MFSPIPTLISIDNASVSGSSQESKKIVHAIRSALLRRSRPTIPGCPALPKKRRNSSRGSIGARHELRYGRTTTLLRARSVISIYSKEKST
jgi:hypothetical protein